MGPSFWPTWNGAAMPIYVNAAAISDTKDGQYLLEFAYVSSGQKYEATDSAIRIVISKELLDSLLRQDLPGTSLDAAK